MSKENNTIGALALRIVVVRENDWWVAQGLEWDLAAQGRTVPEALSRLHKTVATQLCLCLENGVEPLSQAVEAPQVFFKAFDEGISMTPKRDMKIEESLPEAWMIDSLDRMQYKLYA